ncbi:DUF4397 domain-containing protein [Chitinophaga arvensicola]|uniref:DUF4397 domain-containing protein n=1 Tax=Chitinophaga arvensicola TaxID=29529 RepID=A0A1I0RVY7_9BACT|nr:DUF4397 domain-containing protein [Chitinophaga arvensicola]SEW45641.1 protein of unknown function [Chitinophaga arvensicola]
MKRSIIRFLCAAMFIAGCTKDAEMPVSPALSYLMVYNGSPDFYGAGSMAFVNNALYGTRSYNENGAGLVGAFNFSRYSFIDTGLYRMAFTDSATIPANATKITETLLQFENEKHYTVYLLDSLGFFDILYTQDDVAPDPVKAKIRLLHLSPDAGKVYLRIDTVLIGGIREVGFRNVSGYTAVSADIKPGIRIMYKDEAGEEKTLVRKSFPLEAGKCYTMILRGYKTPADGNINKTINLSTITNF